MKEEGYLIGSFSQPSWRQEFIDKLKETYNFDDAREHPQSSIGKLVSSDLNSAATKNDINYVRPGKELGKMSFCENGVGYAHGQPIITIDPNEKKDPILEKISSYKLNSQNEGIEFLKNNKGLTSKFSKLERKTIVKPIQEWEKILFIGDTQRIEELGPKDNVKTAQDYWARLEDLPKEVDGVFVNFNKGWDNEALFFMGLSYGVNLPIISIENNKIPYPPFMGIANLTILGEGGDKNYDLTPSKELSQNLEKAKKRIRNKHVGLHDRTGTKKEWENVALIGSIDRDIIPREKNIQTKLNQNTDLVVANFSENTNSVIKLAQLQLAYNSNIPVIMTTAAGAIHKEMAELTRRVLYGKDRFYQLEEYLKNLKSQHISDEAIVYYKLMQEFNK